MSYMELSRKIQAEETKDQLSHPYMTTGKTIALIRRTFVGKVMSLLLNSNSKYIHLKGLSVHMSLEKLESRVVCYTEETSIFLI